MMKRINYTFLLLLLLTPVMLSLTACSRVPDCDDDNAKETVTSIIFTLINNQFSYDETLTLQKITQEPYIEEKVDDRSAAILKKYSPQALMLHQLVDIAHIIAVQAPEELKDYDLHLYLAMHDMRVLREALSIQMNNMKTLPERVEDGKTYKKVCSATVIINTHDKSLYQASPLTVIYAVNPLPTSSKLHGRNTLYIPVHFFDVSEPPLAFELSNREKVEMMAYGAIKNMQAVPNPQTPNILLAKHGVDALLHQLLAKTKTHQPLQPNKESAL
jgi:hypothetical protein